MSLLDDIDFGHTPPVHLLIKYLLDSALKAGAEWIRFVPVSNGLAVWNSSENYPSNDDLTTETLAPVILEAFHDFERGNADLKIRGSIVISRLEFFSNEFGEGVNVVLKKPVS